MVKDFIKDLKQIRNAIDFIDVDVDELTAEVALLETEHGEPVNTKEVDSFIQFISDAIWDLQKEVNTMIDQYSAFHQELPFDSEERKE